MLLHLISSIFCSLIFIAPSQISCISLTRSLLQQWNPNLTSITKLDLGVKSITDMEPNLFQGLSNLEFLYLDTNMISKLENNTFKGLTNLTFLDISSNSLNKLESLAFNNLENLKILYLDRNKLTKLDYRYVF